MNSSRDEKSSNTRSEIKKTGNSVIERINDYVICSTLSIHEFIENNMNGIVPADYRTAAGIELTACKPALEYCTIKEIDRVAKARSLKRQIEWLCGRIVLKDLLCSEIYPGSDYKNIVIDYNTSGRPYIQGHQDAGISLSHSGDVAMAVFNTAPGRRIGIDVEKTAGIDMASVLSVAFSPEECAYYKDLPAENFIEAFTMKEAYLKVTGQGFHETITRVSVKEHKIIFNGKPVENLGVINRSYRNEYIVSIIYEL